MAAPPDPYASMIAGLQVDSGLSRSQIAAKTGLSRSTVWRLANGVNRNHFVTTIARVEQFLPHAKNDPPVKQK